MLLLLHQRPLLHAKRDSVAASIVRFATIFASEDVAKFNLSQHTKIVRV